VSSKLSINLLQPELLPEKALITLPRVVGVWGIALIVMFALSYFTGIQVESLSAKNQTLSQSVKNNEKQVEMLEKQVAAKKADPQLVMQLDSLKLIMLNKKALHNHLTNKNLTNVKGYSSTMSELSQYHHRDVSLTNVQIDSQNVTMSGIARTPEDVPEWLTGFKDSPSFKGQKFKQFKLTENENKITEFKVSSAMASEAVK